MAAEEEFYYCYNCQHEIDPDDGDTGMLRQDRFGDYNLPGCPYCGKRLTYFGKTRTEKRQGLERKLDEFDDD
ncbi:MAG: hypothetical protein QXH80_00105 [Candidatus Nanoarchaeia archaeon]